jgi:uncharacterized membrane protein
MTSTGPADPPGRCLVCGGTFPRADLRPLSSTSEGVAARVRADFPDAPAEALICRADLANYRRQHVAALLQAERGELTDLDRQVIASLSSGTPVAEDVDATYEERQSFGERAADTIATFGGSWNFIILFVLVLVVWMAVNVTGVLMGGFDPYPFILLNLMLSCIAALQAPVIMMSQRRQEIRDRLRAENDYKVNLKAELEIRHLHEKFDTQIVKQWERLAEIQRVQIEMLEDAMDEARRLGGRRREP